MSTLFGKPKPMKHKLSHFALYIDDMDRAMEFYQSVFDWGFKSYGPDDFRQITTGDTENEEVIGALQSRKYSPVREKVIGMEGTIEGRSVDSIINAVKEGGGTVVMPKTAIPGVGWLTKFLDTEGNLVCAMETDENAS